VLALVRRQCRGWLIEDDDAAGPRQRLADFHQLPLRNGEIANQRVGRQPGSLAELRQQPPHLGAHPPPAQRPAHAEPRQHDILEHGKIRRERGLLHDHRHTAADRVARASEVHWARVDAELAAVRLQVA
jgi:hypothetical protein